MRPFSRTESLHRWTVNAFWFYFVPRIYSTLDRQQRTKATKIDFGTFISLLLNELKVGSTCEDFVWLSSRAESNCISLSFGCISLSASANRLKPMQCNNRKKSESWKSFTRTARLLLWHNQGRNMCCGFSFKSAYKIHLTTKYYERERESDSWLSCVLYS